jgi:dihydrofolate synthase / folylpolyglutamate synthase
MNLTTLEEWVSYISSLHTVAIELGLERVKAVAERMGLLEPGCAVISIAGTNGKGSCVAGLEAVYLAAGYRVGAFTSPYLLRLNEEIRIQGKEIDDDTFCQAFSEIEAARGEISLTPFEFNTLAALKIFKQSALDIMLLEVGLGGRLDAVNIIDADLAVVTSIAIDHADWLGNTRELIAREKAGVFRAGKPVVCGDASPPQSLLNIAKELGAPLFCQKKDFRFTQQKNTWDWASEKTCYENLPLTVLALQNMATVMMAVEVMQTQLPVTRAAIDQALLKVELPARIQIIPGKVTKIFDVSHNPAAAEFLANKLQTIPCTGKTRAVFSMLVDKDIVGTIQVMKNLIDDWYIAALPVQRGTAIGMLQETFRKAKVEKVKSHPDIVRAYQSALDDSKDGDRVIVFGSFYTVAGVITQKL